MDLSIFLQAARYGICPSTSVPAGKEGMQEKILDLDSLRFGSCLTTVSGLALAILCWPPYNKSSLALLLSYSGYEAQRVFKNLQEIYLRDEKLQQAKQSKEKLFELMTEQTPIARRILPFLMRLFYPIERIQQEIARL